MKLIDKDALVAEIERRRDYKCRAFTSLEQSKKLAEILSLESADMCYRAYREEGGILDYFATLCPYQFASWVGVPCWSLAVLLKVIPKKIKDFNVLRIDINEKDFSIWYDEIGSGVNTELPDITMECPVDACYEMVMHLNELNLL